MVASQNRRPAAATKIPAGIKRARARRRRSCTRPILWAQHGETSIETRLPQPASHADAKRLTLRGCSGDHRSTLRPPAAAWCASSAQRCGATQGQKREARTRAPGHVRILGQRCSESPLCTSAVGDGHVVNFSADPRPHMAGIGADMAGIPRFMCSRPPRASVLGGAVCSSTSASNTYNLVEGSSFVSYKRMYTFTSKQCLALEKNI
jgi:hypothetical protein